MAAKVQLSHTPWVLPATHDAVPAAERGARVPRAQSPVWIAADVLLEIQKGEHVAAVATDHQTIKPWASPIPRLRSNSNATNGDVGISMVSFASAIFNSVLVFITLSKLEVCKMPIVSVCTDLSRRAKVST